jgi:hypothetical protein
MRVGNESQHRQAYHNESGNMIIKKMIELEAPVIEIYMKAP